MNINPMRLTGLATGMDTESMVRQMMQPYQMRLDKMNQDRQIIQWRQELYRDIIGDIYSFKNNFFDVLKKDSYMLSKNTFSTFNIDGITGNDVKVVANAGAKVGDYTLTVDQIADNAKVEGSTCINKVVVSSPNVQIKIDENNNEFALKLQDGSNVSIKIPIDETKGYNTYENVGQLASVINKQISDITIGDEKLSDKVKAVVKDGNIQFSAVTTVSEGDKINFSYDGQDYEVSLAEGNYTAEQLVSSINSKLSGLTSIDGSTTFPEGKSLSAETTEAGTIFKMDDGTSIDIKNGENSISLGFISIDSIEPGDMNDAAVEIGTGGNSLVYKPKIIEGLNDTLNIRLGGEIKTIKLQPGIAPSDADFIDKLNEALINGGVSQDDLKVSLEDGKVSFTSSTGEQISIFGNASRVFGAYDNFEINMKSSEKMSNLINTNVKFKINDVVFEYDFANEYSEECPTGAKGKTIEEILTDIKTKAGVDISYSETTKKFTISSRNTGSNSNIYIEDTEGSFFKTIFGDKVFSETDASLNSKTLYGKDAVFTLKDPSGESSTYSKPENSFTIDGVTYTLNGKPTEDIKFNLTTNTEESFDKIKEFIGKYNELIDKINDKVSEKKSYSYLPLTDEQKKDMSEDEIKKWEKAAKKGLLRNDSNLDNMINSLRSAFFSGVKGVSISLKEIGLDTSRDYTQKGKIVINEAKLKEALKNRGEEISELFTKQSSSYSNYNSKMSYSERKIRYEEEGIFQRVNDIINDYARNTDGKGILLKKAGMEGDFTYNENILSEYIEQKDKKIKEMQKKLYEREDRYYMQFASLERAMNQMNAQSSWLMQQFSAG